MKDANVNVTEAFKVLGTGNWSIDESVGGRWVPDVVVSASHPLVIDRDMLGLTNQCLPDKRRTVLS